MFRIENITYLNGLYILPILIFLFWKWQRWRKNKLSQFIDNHLFQKLFSSYSKKSSVFKQVLFLVSYIFLIIALINPQIGTKIEKIKREGVDLMICLDISNSMLAQDIKPNRIKKAKLSIQKLIDQLSGDRIGIIVFAGQAFVQLPITSDYSAAKLFLSNISTNTIKIQGTNIGAAIDLAVESFGTNNINKGGKAIIILTDGENHEEGAIESAEIAAEKGIRIFTIGMGSEKGAPIPIKVSMGNKTFLKNKDNETVITKLNSETLQKIANKGNGYFQYATNMSTGLDKIFNEISGMDKTEFGKKIYTDYEDRFVYFLSIAFILLVIQMSISDKKIKWIKQIKIFK